MTSRLATKWRTTLLALTATGIATGVAVAGGFASASATETPAAHAAPAHASHLTAGAPASLPANLSRLRTIQPSFYVTPSGRQLTAAEVAKNRPDAREAIGVFFLNVGQEAKIGGIHTCTTLSPVVGGVTGVECADMVGYSPESNVVDAIAAGEGYCQTGDGLVTCPAIKFIAQEAVAPFPGTAALSPSGVVECGPGYTACADNGREEFTDYAANWQKTGCNTDPGEGNEFWTEVLPSTIV